jgi:SMI1-KNR4 cell-wall
MKGGQVRMESEHNLAMEIAARVNGRFGAVPRSICRITDVELDAAERELRARLPRSYRVFLRYFGAQALPDHDLFGLPRDRLWGDIVLLNDLGAHPRHYVKFTEDGEGRSYYFDTTRVDDDGECPVVVRDGAGDEAEVAPTFLMFLASAAPHRLVGIHTA